jgi:cytochrome c
MSARRLATTHATRLALALLPLLLLPHARVRGAESGAELVRALRCHPCHDQTRYLIGPPWQAIAARHAANKEAMIDVLAGKILRGGAGTWGVIPMVPSEHVTLEQARTLARWILDQPVDAPAR